MSNVEFDKQQIKNILFDLGGVLLNINYQLTEDAFINLGLKNFSEIYTQDCQQKLFHDFEKGNISSSDFLNTLQDIFDQPITHKELIHAWNAMLLDFPNHRYEMLKTLGSNYKLFLISNTNEIHFNTFNKIFEGNYGHPFSSLFVKDYYSHIEGKRKPDEDIFEHILMENDLVKEETLFLDDTEEHVEAARAFGIQSNRIKNVEVSELLRSIGILT